jgi:hypothetical protein
MAQRPSRSCAIWCSATAGPQSSLHSPFLADGHPAESGGRSISIRRGATPQEVSPRRFSSCGRPARTRPLLLRESNWRTRCTGHRNNGKRSPSQRRGTRMRTLSTRAAGSGGTGTGMGTRTFTTAPARRARPRPDRGAATDAGCTFALVVDARRDRERQVAAWWPEILAAAGREAENA